VNATMDVRVTLSVIFVYHVENTIWFLGSGSVVKVNEWFSIHSTL